MELISKQKELGSKNGFPKPKKVECSQCSKNFEVKFVIPKQSYSQKNNWGYWTGKEENKKVNYCNDCLRNNYYNKTFYWKSVEDKKKRLLFKSYIHEGRI
ncbi:MAG: hypothetical protein MRECE_59c004 [Mycoplasmataceae bacterium CE_OT135]|nr:MAG: hypothetical protein MRECE_59c004 [Mycoplasmataceae bacterium CE_OT135]